MSLEARGSSGCRQPRAARLRRVARAQRRLHCCPRALTACCACAARPPGRAQAIRSSSTSRRDPPARIDLAGSACLSPVSALSGEVWGGSSASAAAVSETTPFLTRATVALVAAALAAAAAAAMARRVAAAAWWLSSCPAVSWRESVCWPRCGHRAQPQPLACPTAHRPASLSMRSRVGAGLSRVRARPLACADARWWIRCLRRAARVAGGAARRDTEEGVTHATSFDVSTSLSCICSSRLCN